MRGAWGVIGLTQLNFLLTVDFEAVSSGPDLPDSVALVLLEILLRKELEGTSVGDFAEFRYLSKSD